MPAVIAEPRTGSARRPDTLAAIVAAIVAVQAVMFIVAARRGFDLTDEGFYFLSFRHWREWPSVSFFGAYFSAPFTALGHDPWAIRVLGFALLIASATWFGAAMCRAFDALAGRSESAGIAAAAMTCGAGIWSYYGAFFVPYTPSYNLLSLASALVTLALALELGCLLLRSKRRGTTASSFVLGLAGSIGIASKFSSGIVVFALAVLIVVTIGWKYGDRRGAWLRIGAAAAAGTVLNLAVLWLADPNLPSQFRKGIVLTLAMMQRSPSRELATLIGVDLPGEILVSLRILLWPMVGAVLAFGVAVLLHRRPIGNSVGVLILVAGSLLFTFVKDNHSHRLVLATVLAFLVAAAAWQVSGRDGTPVSRWRAAIVAVAILVAPFAYSIGTNNPLLRHMGMAAIFPLALVVMRLRSLYFDRAIARPVFAVCLLFAASLPAEIVVRQWVDGRYTYRLGASLAEQSVPLPANPGAIDLDVAPALARTLDAYLSLLHSAGYVPGQRMIDFTGQSPGLVAIANGAPVGAIWFVGGRMFDGDAMAQRALGYVDAAELRAAWLLTSEDGPTAIRSWRTILGNRLGAFTHEEAGRFAIPDPSSNDKSTSIEVTLWRPRRQAAAVATEPPDRSPSAPAR